MITIAPNILGPATLGEAFSSLLAGSGGTGPYTFGLLMGSLPSGLTLGTDGTISGTPTTAGSSDFTIRATDSLGAYGDQAYSFRIKPPVYWYICTRSAETPLIPPNAADQRDHNRKVANALESLTKSRERVGNITPRPALKDIPDHLLCDGSEVSRLSFPQLFAEIGTTWGEGDGSTTFNIPDLIGGAIPVAVTAPAQIITPTTVTTAGTVVTQPTTSSQTGGTSGGGTSTGARPYPLSDNPINVE